MEYWLDPEAASRSSPSSPDNPSSDTATPASEAAPPTPAPPVVDQPKVFCRKGKCYPYDPDKINPNVNLEMKPGILDTRLNFYYHLLTGMILTASEPNSNQRKHKQKQMNRNLEQEQNVEGGKTQKGDEIWKLFYH